jgi:hypothetical protein
MEVCLYRLNAVEMCVSFMLGVQSGGLVVIEGFII